MLYSTLKGNIILQNNVRLHKNSNKKNNYQAYFHHTEIDFCV